MRAIANIFVWAVIGTLMSCSDAPSVSGDPDADATADVSTDVDVDGAPDRDGDRLDGDDPDPDETDSDASDESDTPDAPDEDGDGDGDDDDEPDCDDTDDGDETDIEEDPDADADEPDAPSPCRTPVDPDTAVGEWLLIGGGIRSFEPIDCLEDVPIINGIQGGQHVWGGLRAGGFDTSGVWHIDFELIQDEVVVAFATYVDTLIPEGDKVEYSAVTVILEEGEGHTGDSVADREALLHLHLWNEAGASYEDEILIMPYCCEF